MEEENSNLIKRSSPPHEIEPSLAKILEEKTKEGSKIKSLENETICKNYIIFSLLFLVGLLFFLIYGYKFTLKEDKLSKLIEKKWLDSRNFKFIKLNNDIKVFLVQDNSSETSSFSLDLSVGLNAETGEILGVSHLLAHLILMNSKSYPNFYLEYFLKSHGGDVNLLIEAERTNFYFSVNQHFLEQSVEIFAYHLKEPNFIKETFEDTIELIEKEFLEESEINNHKILSLIKKLADKNHIFSKCFEGNKKSLFEIPQKNKLNILEELELYFNKYYSGNLMNIILISNHSCEYMEKIVKENFLHVKNNRLPSKNPEFYPQPFLFNQSGKVVLFESHLNEIEISLIFPMPELTTHFKRKPLQYIISLYNKKTPNSFHWFLKNEGLIYNMETGIIFEGSDFSLFHCKFIVPKNLTEKISYIIDIFYAYTDLVTKFGVKEEFFSELERVSNILFNFEDKKDDFYEIQRIAENLKLFPISNILNGDQIFFEYDEELIRNFLSYINPKNSITVLSLKGFEINDESIRLQQLNEENDNLLQGNSKNQNNYNNTHIFRFTDLNSLKEELKDLKEKASFKNKMPSNKYEMMDLLVMNNSNFIDLNETDFSNINKIPLDSFDDLNKIFYRILPLSSKILFNLSEKNYSFLNGTIKISEANRFISSNFSLYYSCLNEPNTHIVNDKNFISKKNANETNNYDNKTNIHLTEITSTKNIYFLNSLNISIHKICEKKNETIVLLQSNQTSFPIYFNFEKKFNLPKISLFFDLIFNYSLYTTKTNMLFLMLSEILFESIESQMFDALISGNYFEIKANHHGFEIYLESFNDMITIFSKEFLKAFFNFTINEFFFSRIKEILIAKIKDEKFDDPLKKSIKIFQKIMTNYNHIYQEKIYELNAINFEAFKIMLLDFEESLIINKFFIYGNYLQNDTNLLIDEIIKSFKSTQINSWNSTHLIEKNLSEQVISTILSNDSIKNNSSKNDLNNSNSSIHLNLNNYSSKMKNFTNKTEDKNQTEYISSLFYKNVSYIPMSFLNLNSSNVRFLFDDKKNDFNDKNVLLNYLQYGFCNDSKNYTMLWMISLYLDSKFEEYIRNYTSFPVKFIKKNIQVYVEKNIYGLLIVLELSKDLNISCVEFILDKFYEIIHKELAQISEQEFESLGMKTLFLLSKMDLKFRQKGKRIWQEILNGFDMNSILYSEIKDFAKNITKNQLVDFHSENFLEKNRKMSIKIIKKNEIMNNFFSNLKFNKFVCGINPKILKKLNNNQTIMEEDEDFNKTENLDDLKEELIENMKIFSSILNSNNIENINDLGNIPKFTLFF